jgi:DNA integrity scanning protein DisA with diadenylate cyclase activity
MEKDYDGAVLIDRTGQLLGARVYVEVTKPNIDHEVQGTRHLAAVSGSTLEEVISTIALSQTTNKVTMYKKGKQEDIYEPEVKSKEDDEQDS